MDYELLARQLVRALRGKRSQTAANRRLGRTSNALHAWETGTRYPRASDLLKLVRLAKADPLAALAPFDAPPALFSSKSQQVAAWLEALRQGRSQAELALALGINRNTVARWLAGVTEPRLPELLHFLATTTQRLPDFVAALVDPELVPCIAPVFRDLAAQRRLAYESPWAHAVLRALELGAYRELRQHERGVLAALTGISVEDEDALLAQLAAVHQIRRSHGKWLVRRVLNVDTRLDAAANFRLKQHWAEVAARRLDGGRLPSESTYSYNLFAISEEGLAQIRAAHLEYYARIRSIVDECRNPTRVVLANVQLLPLAASSAASRG